MSEFTVRSATPDDGQFLAEMVVEAANWRPAPARPRVTVLADPNYAHYLSGWQRPADRGVVATDASGEPIGAAWYRLFPANAPAHGFVSVGVPELIIGVRHIWRAQGVGRALLRELVGEARRAGHSRLALSVEQGNFAAALYRSEGFDVVSGAGVRETMVLNLR